MNATQIQNIIMPIISAVAGYLAGAHILFDASTWSNILLGLVSLGATIYAGVSTRNKALVSQTASLPEVSSIKLDQSAPASMVATTPNNVTK